MLNIILGLIIYFIVIYLIALKQNNHGLVDVAWGLGFVFSGLIALINQDLNLTKVIGYMMLIVWGLRLSIYLFMRNYGKVEDPRYQAMRLNWTKHPYLYSFIQVYLLQAVLLFLINQPFYALASLNQPELSYLSGLALAIWLIGFLFEVIGDSQLNAFRKNPLNKGKLLTTGLRAYTRHPNYFGEAVMWWSMSLYAYSVGASIYVLFSAVLITLLLRYVSGVPLLEKRYKDRLDFKAYASETSVFIPWFKRKTK
ncbi:MAG: DUF1295 domain-containing protein [Erysipelotrichaceae bacterium]